MSQQPSSKLATSGECKTDANNADDTAFETGASANLEACLSVDNAYVVIGAASNNRHAIVIALLDKHPKWVDSALITAAKHGHVGIVHDLLAKYTFVVFALDEALQWACAMEHIQTADVLLNEARNIWTNVIHGIYGACAGGSYVAFKHMCKREDALDDVRYYCIKLIDLVEKSCPKACVQTASGKKCGHPDILADLRAIRPPQRHARST